MIEVSTHSKYITEKDLLEWENSLKGDNKVKRLINKVYQNEGIRRFDRLS